MSFADAAKALTLPPSKLFEGVETVQEHGKGEHLCSETPGMLGIEPARCTGEAATPSVSELTSVNGE